MAIWLGRDGGIKIERKVTGSVYSYIRVSDVDSGVKRFSLDKPVPCSSRGTVSKSAVSMIRGSL